MNKKGFTLVEVLVSLFIFSIMAGAITSSFITTIRTQRHVLDEQKMFSEISYSLEYMGRQLRLAQKDLVGDCITQGNNYLIDGSGNKITFLNWDGNCQEFALNNGSITEIISSDHRKDNLSDALKMTSSSINIEELVFSDAGSNYGQGGDQPKVLIVIAGQSRDLGIPIRVQTLVSQRKLNRVISS